MKRIIEVALCVGFFGATLAPADEVVLPPVPVPVVDPMIPVPFPDAPASKTPYIPQGKVYTMPEEEGKPKGTVMTPTEQKKASPFLVPALPAQTSEPPIGDPMGPNSVPNPAPSGRLQAPRLIEPPLVVRPPTSGPNVASPPVKVPPVAAPEVIAPAPTSPALPQAVLGAPVEVPAETVAESPQATLMAPEAVDAASQEPVRWVDGNVFGGLMEPLVFDESQGRVPPRFSLRHDIGHGVGYRNGFTYVEGFVPFQHKPDAVFFSDTRVVNFDHRDRWEFNLGAGYRTYASGIGAVLGLNTFYDGRQNDGRYYQQLGVGVEALHSIWEFRCNGYFILGEQRKQIAESSVLVPSGPNFNLATTKVYGVAMNGMNAEFGGPLPCLDRWYPRVYLGYYHYSGDGVPTTNGVRGRFEAQLTRCLSLHFAAQNDPVFDTTVSGGLALHLGAGAFRNCNRGRPTLQDILGQRVVRDVNIVIHESTTTSNQFIQGTQPTPPKEECEQECEQECEGGRKGPK